MADENKIEEEVAPSLPDPSINPPKKMTEVIVGSRKTTVNRDDLKNRDFKPDTSFNKLKEATEKKYFEDLKIDEDD